MNPSFCAAVRAALDAQSLEPAVQQQVDLADGAVAAVAGGSINVLVGGGCISVGGSDGGEPLTVDALTVLATAAIGRLG